MPVIIKEFDVISEPSAPQQQPAEVSTGQKPVRSADIEQINRFLVERRRRIHAD